MVDLLQKSVRCGSASARAGRVRGDAVVDLLRAGRDVGLPGVNDRRVLDLGQRLQGRPALRLRRRAIRMFASKLGTDSDPMPRSTNRANSDCNAVAWLIKMASA